MVLIAATTAAAKNFTNALSTSSVFLSFAAATATTANQKYKNDKNSYGNSNKERLAINCKIIRHKIS